MEYLIILLAGLVAWFLVRLWVGATRLATRLVTPKPARTTSAMWVKGEGASLYIDGQGPSREIFSINITPGQNHALLITSDTGMTNYALSNDLEGSGVGRSVLTRYTNDGAAVWELYPARGRSVANMVERVRISHDKRIHGNTHTTQRETELFTELE